MDGKDSPGESGEPLSFKRQKIYIYAGFANNHDGAHGFGFQKSL